jgi:hypothetical protein
MLLTKRSTCLIACSVSRFFSFANPSPMAWMAKAAVVSIPTTALLNDKTRFACKSAPTALSTNRGRREYVMSSWLRKMIRRFRFCKGFPKKNEGIPQTGTCYVLAHLLVSNPSWRHTAADVLAHLEASADQSTAVDGGRTYLALTSRSPLDR